MSGNRKQSQVKPDCGGAAKAQPLATGRLKPLRLFSTPHIWGIRPRQTLKSIIRTFALRNLRE